MFRYPLKLENLTITPVFSVLGLDKRFVNASHLKISGILIPPAGFGFLRVNLKEYCFSYFFIGVALYKTNTSQMHEDFGRPCD